MKTSFLQKPDTNLYFVYGILQLSYLYPNSHSTFIEKVFPSCAVLIGAEAIFMPLRFHNISDFAWTLVGKMLEVYKAS